MAKIVHISKINKTLSGVDFQIESYSVNDNTLLIQLKMVNDNLQIVMILFNSIMI